MSIPCVFPHKFSWKFSLFTDFYAAPFPFYRHISGNLPPLFYLTGIGTRAVTGNAALPAFCMDEYGALLAGFQNPASGFFQAV